MDQDHPKQQVHPKSQLPENDCCHRVYGAKHIHEFRTYFMCKNLDLI